MRHACWFPAYVGIGSNLSDPPRQVRAAFGALARLADTRLIAASALYRNPPFGRVPQPDFVNAVAGLLTRLEPLELFRQFRAIERAQGRSRAPGEKWGPRTLDLDLLVYADRILSTPELTIPHPGISERNFVLLPLLEVAPGLEIPGHGSVAGLAAGLDRTGLEKID